VKKITAVILLLTFLFSLAWPSFAYFQDVNKAEDKLTVYSLFSLDIMNGMSSSSFSPNSYLTRAQFCKIAVMALGFDEISSYSSYTTFPDVKHTHWSSPYVNAAVKKYKIIQGFPDGTFRPDDILTFGQACTILLNMLGYTVSDVGPFWPRDYVAKAKELGLTEGIALNPNDKIPRINAAKMAKNLLLTVRKDEAVFINSLYPTQSDVIILSTSETDPSLSKGKVRLYQGGSSSITASSHNIPADLIGVYGTAVYSKNNPSSLFGFVPYDGNMKTVRADKISAQRIDTLSDGSFDIPSSAMVVSNGEIDTYSNKWIDIVSGTDINIFYDDKGKVSLISQSAQSALSQPTVYTRSEPFGSSGGNIKVVKNGVASSASDVAKYDVISYSSTDGTYYVSDKKLQGILTSAGPTYTHPTTVTVFGREFSVPDYASSYFSNIKIGSSVTLLFDAAGKVAAAYPSDEIPFTQYGILEKLKGSDIRVSMLSGFSYDGPANLSLYQTSGVSSDLRTKLVRITQQTTGDISISPVYMSPPYENLNVSSATLGSKKLSPRVRIFEQVSDMAPLYEISLSDIPEDVVSSRFIRHASTNSSGQIDLLILHDVTGLAYEYGILTGSTSTDSNGMTLTLKNSYGEKTYPTHSLSGVNGTVGAVAKGVDEFDALSPFPYKILSPSATVSIDAFDGSKGVKTASAYIPISEDVEVYSSSKKAFITLSEARVNFTSFDIYCNRSPSSGGKVCVIVAK